MQRKKKRNAPKVNRPVSYTHLDVYKRQALEGAVAEGLDRFGRLDIVVANAGVMATSLFTELSEQAWDEIVGTNLTGVWKTVRAAAPAIMAGERGGSVVITSSIAGLKGMWVSAPYVASKHGVTGLMKTMALEPVSYTHLDVYKRQV